MADILGKGHLVCVASSEESSSHFLFDALNVSNNSDYRQHEVDRYSGEGGRIIG